MRTSLNLQKNHLLDKFVNFSFQVFRGYRFVQLKTCIDSLMSENICIQENLIKFIKESFAGKKIVNF